MVDVKRDRSLVCCFSSLLRILCLSWIETAALKGVNQISTLEQQTCFLGCDETVVLEFEDVV